MSGLLSRYEGHPRNFLEACIAIGTLLDVRWETECPFLVATVILGFLSILRRNQALSHFEALNSACPLKCQRDVRPLVDMR